MKRQVAGGSQVFSEPLDLSSATAAFRARFWSKVDRGDVSKCWPWLAHCKANGYGQFTLRKGRFITASRVAYALANGPLAQNQQVCHTCDNPPCCNPSHLFAGTNRDNTIDCIVKGRANRSHGEAHRDARLSEDMVRIIRATDIQPGTKTLLAKKYGVSTTAIRRVLAFETWRHVR